MFCIIGLIGMGDLEVCHLKRPWSSMLVALHRKMARDIWSRISLPARCYFWLACSPSTSRLLSPDWGRGKRAGESVQIETGYVLK